ncbi:hypothetical protein P171DRAFT_156588 [Karstenula rhodostoma CBS 690.94]|uniref:Uncharacterized protein n=1 Tax=Karstenula rhodostoma CBS 690.94 TaxID=1392251 RepID=A0A9P4P7F7_9PLEO|nr:hypothetical protein P171DRAFT_156588 [Karstenula rhodostoma CBS 690.94]
MTQGCHPGSHNGKGKPTEDEDASGFERSVQSGFYCAFATAPSYQAMIPYSRFFYNQDSQSANALCLGNRQCRDGGLTFHYTCQPSSSTTVTKRRSVKLPTMRGDFTQTLCAVACNHTGGRKLAPFAACERNETMWARMYNARMRPGTNNDPGLSRFTLISPYLRAAVPANKAAVARPFRRTAPLGAQTCVSKISKFDSHTMTLLIPRWAGMDL